MEVKVKTVEELKQMMDGDVEFQLIDVREEYEYDICNLEGELIPLGTIPDYVDSIHRDRPVIVYCRSGARSARAVQFLQEQGGFDNLYNLEGGVKAWAERIDPSMPTY